MAIPSAMAKSAKATGARFWVSNCAPSKRSPFRWLGVPDHHVTSTEMIALITSAAAVIAVATLLSSQRRRVTVWVHTSTFVACSVSRAISVAPRKTPSTSGNGDGSGGRCR